MVEYPSIVISAVMAVIIYLSYKILKWVIVQYNKPTPKPTYNGTYMDDEPDGSNYVTMPNGDRRLD